MEQSDQTHLQGEKECVCVCESGSALHPGAAQQGGQEVLGTEQGSFRKMMRISTRQSSVRTPSGLAEEEDMRRR